MFLLLRQVLAGRIEKAAPYRQKEYTTKLSDLLSRETSIKDGTYCGALCSNSLEGVRDAIQACGSGPLTIMRILVAGSTRTDRRCKKFE
jgi:hypothetical protein